jgi:tetratricopeptide (TPR) repeat protein
MALVKFVGAGLVVVASACGVHLPAGQHEAGVRLIERLSATKNAGAQTFLTGIVRDFWRSCQNGDFAHAEAERHFTALAGIMQDLSQPSLAGTILNFNRQAEQNEPLGSLSLPSPFCEAILAHARASGAFAANGLNEPLVLFFLDRLFTCFFSDQSFYERLNSALAPEAASDRDGVQPEAGAETQVARPIGSKVQAPAYLVNKAGVPSAAMRAIYVALNERKVPAAEVEQRMIEKALALHRMLVRIAAPSKADVAVVELRSRAGQAIAGGRFSEADQLFGQAEDFDIRAAQEKLDFAAQYLRSAAVTRADRAMLEELRSDYWRAARHYAAAQRCVPMRDHIGRWFLAAQRAKAFAKQSDEFNDARAFKESVTAYREALGFISRGDWPDEWAETQLGLADILTARAEQDVDPAWFEQAAQHLRAAVAVHAERNSTAAWTAAQTRLADLSRLAGERYANVDWLDACVTEYRCLLEVHRRDNAQLDWARTQLGLASALGRLGEIESSVIRLEQAIAALETALSVLTPADAPEDWFRAKICHGSLLARLGEVDQDIDRVDSAVNSLRAVLATVSRDQLPEVWARGQLAFANALSSLAKLEDNDGRREEAIAAFRAALENCARTRAPFAFAATQAGLGGVLWDLGKSRRDVTMLAEAAQAKMIALDVFEAARAHAGAATIRQELQLLDGDVQKITSVEPSSPGS